MYHSDLHRIMSISHHEQTNKPSSSIEKTYCHIKEYILEDHFNAH